MIINLSKTVARFSLILGLIQISSACYAQSTNSVISLSGTLPAQATVIVISNDTQYLAGRDNGVPGLPGVALKQNIELGISCTNSMLVELLLNSLNGFSLRSNSVPHLKVPYSVSISNYGFSSYNQTPIAIMASIVCKNEVIQVPIDITTGRLPYGLSAGTYNDVMVLNLSY